MRHQLLDQCSSVYGGQQSATETPCDQLGGVSPPAHSGRFENRQNEELKEDDTTILTELAEELMNEDRAPYTDTLLVASIGNYAGYVAKEVQTKNSVSSCCKEELCDEGEIEIRIQELMYPPSSRPSLTLWIEALSLIAPAFSRGLACQWPTWCPSEY